MILFTVPSSPFGARIRIQAFAKGLALDTAAPPGGLGSEEFLVINPFGKVPVLRTDDGDIIESAVIQEYLEDRHPEPNLRGETLIHIAAVRTFTRAIDLYLFPALFGLRAAAGGQFDALAKTVDEMAVVVDRLAALKSGNYLCGSSLTLADCALAPAYFYIDRFAGQLGFPSPFMRHHDFTTWWARIKDTEAAGSVIADLASIAVAKEAASE